jgi:outer membrane protein assembly factor BamD
MNIARIFSVLLISLMLFACANKKKEAEKILPVEQLYNESMDKLENKNYTKAIEGFADVERTYPYSPWATKAQIISAYANFKAEEYNNSIVNLDRFIALHPGNKYVEYAYYLKAMCYYEQISDVARDQSNTVTTLAALKEVIARFPTSPYASDAQGKLDLVLDHLAGKELEIGRFYLGQQKYIAAINRFKEVLNKYQTTSHVPEALHRLVEANLSLGLKDEAKKYAAVLGYNYPGSKWYEYSYNLIEGKKPENSPAKNAMQKLIEKIKHPMRSLKKEPNLVDSLDKKPHENLDDKRLYLQPFGPEIKLKPHPDNADKNVQSVN